VLPDFTNRVKEGAITARWNSRVTAIEPTEVVLSSAGRQERLKADRVYVMTGFAPSVELLRETGVPIDPNTGIPKHDPETLETPVAGVFVAGVLIAGYDANRIFIENGRYHGDRIMARVLGQRPPSEPKLSGELDS
jgi:thioredoxin reductase (NADPH)